MFFDVPSAFAAEEPAACFGYGGALAIDLVIRALAPIIPNGVTAGGPGSSWNISMVGWDRTREALFISGEALAGGWGADAAADGGNAVIHMDAGDFKNTPVETAENRYPINITSYQLGTDTGGAGKFRGGLNIIKGYRNLADTSMLGIQFGRTVTPSWGLFQGHPGSTPRVLIYPGTSQAKTVSKVNQLPLNHEDMFEAHTGGGGGYGPPWERDVWRVQEDVADGYVSVDEARKTYGVIIADNLKDVDKRATIQARQQLSSVDNGSQTSGRRLDTEEGL
jgi:N-methylhydantoinase B